MKEKSTPVLTPDLESVLRRQSFGDDGPGTILADFSALLNLIAPGNLNAAGQNHILPIKILSEFNAQLRWSCQLQLDRPKMLSFPNIEGLFLLARASGLVIVQGTRDKARLALNPPLMEAWLRLNSIERYFNLLETWLLHADPQIIGSRFDWQGDYLHQTLSISEKLPRAGLAFPKHNPNERYLPVLGTMHHVGVLMAQFGLIEIQQATPTGKSPSIKSPWHPKSASPLPFGDALLTLLWPQAGYGMDMDEWRMIDADATKAAPNFGHWQPIFQPFFPQWQNNLSVPPAPFRDGVWIFKVRWDKVWRQIAVPPKRTLDDLADAILRAFRFDSDHLYSFTYTNRIGRKIEAMHAASIADLGVIGASDVRIGDLPLDPGATLKFLYDFGDNWLFDVELQQIAARDPKLKSPRVLARHGQPPRQYPDWDEDGFEDEEGDEEDEVGQVR